MPRRELFLKGNYYHIYNRGASQGKLFFSNENYLHCLRLMKKYAESFFISILAYCLMPNHYHFLLRQDGEISLAKFINVLFNAYVQAVNKQRGRKGTLFAGRFKHVHIDKNEYLMHLCRYIHLNPVDAGIVSNPEDWAYSNYREWIGTRSGTLIDYQFVSDQFSSSEDYKKFVVEYQIEKELQIQEALKLYYLDK